MPKPVAYLSLHGEEVVDEIRIAVYPHPGTRSSVFTYTWEVVHDLEAPEWVQDAIIERILEPLGVKLLKIIEGLLPDERGLNGEKLFHGPPVTAD